jgi:hypothetical protein
MKTGRGTGELPPFIDCVSLSLDSASALSSPGTAVPAAQTKKASCLLTYANLSKRQQGGGKIDSLQEFS